MTSKIRNLIFILLFIIIILAVASFNYVVDSYNLIHKIPPSIYIDDYPREMYPLVLKQSQKTKFNYLVMGSSTTKGFIFPELLYDKKAIYITIANFNIADEAEYFERILDLHPEIHTIIIPIEFAFYFFYEKNRLPEIKGNKLTIKELTALLLSSEITMKSINKLKNKFLSKIAIMFICKT